MAILSKGTDFSTGDQVTAAKLDALVDSATFASGAVDNVSTALDGSSPQKIIVKDGGISTARLADDSATPAKVSFVDDSLAATDGHILVADGSEYNNVPVSGDVTIDNTGAVTIADDAVESSMIADDVALGGNPTTTTQTSGDDSTRIATTAFVQDALGEQTPNNRLRVKILPSDFEQTGTSSNRGINLSFNGASIAVPDLDCAASYDIPAGFKATEVVIYGTSITFYVYLNDITSESSTSLGQFYISGTGSTTANIADVTGSDTNYLTIRLTDGTSNRISGGYITLAAV